MPPAIVAVVAAVATAVVYYTVTNIIIAAILIIAINVAAALLMRRPAGKTNQGMELKLKLDPTMPRQLMLGRMATGGSVVWAFTYGSSSNAPGGLYLVRIIAISDLPCTALAFIFEGMNSLTWDGDVTTGWRTMNGGHYTDAHNPRMMGRVWLGSESPIADSNLISWSGGGWSSQHKGTNMCYAAFRYQFDIEGDAFPSGEPVLTFVMDGVKCYDDRKDSTKPGGSGSHRLATPSTWEFTRNTAILVAQAMRGWYSKGQLIVGAGAEERDLDTAMLFSAYATCDEIVQGGIFGTQKRYESGIMANSAEPLANLLLELQSGMDGRVIDRGGAITIRPGATHTPVFNLTDADIIWTRESSWQPLATLSEIYNSVAGVYVEEYEVWSEKGYPPLTNAQWEIDDGGERFNYQVSFAAVNDWSRVQRISKRIHDHSRFQGTVAFYLPLWGLEMEQNDWFTLTSARFGFTTKYFDAMTVDVVDTMHVMVIGRETSLTIDGWDPAVHEKPRTDTTWNAPQVQLPIPIIDVEALYSSNATTKTESFGVQLEVTGMDAPNTIAPTSMHVQIAPQATKTPVSDLPSASGQNQTLEYYGLNAATAYSVRARSVRGPSTSSWTAWKNFTTAQPIYSLIVTLPVMVVITANYLGVPNAGQLPREFLPSVKKGAVDVRLDNGTTYSANFITCTGTVNNTNGSPDKGMITINTIGAAAGRVVLTVTNSGVTAQAETAFQRQDAAVPPPTGGGGGGSSGTQFVWTGFETVTTNAFDPFSLEPTPIGTITLTANQKIKAEGTLSYSVYDGTKFIARYLTVKLQYSVAGANTWVDVGSQVTGSMASRGGIQQGGGMDGEPVFEEKVIGEVTVNQTTGALAAGNYDVQLVGKHDATSGTWGLAVVVGGMIAKAVN